MNQPSKFALEEAAKHVYVNPLEPVEIVVFGTVYVYSKTADAAKAVDRMVVNLAQILDQFHQTALGLSIWVQPVGDKS